MPATIDSNKTGLTYAEEVSLQVLAAVPVWYPLEPNTYSAFGGDLKTVSREPINATRQRSKGTVTDLDVTAGFAHDFIQGRMARLLQGFFFAFAHQKPQTQPLHGAPVVITGVTLNAGLGINVTAAAGLAVFPAMALVKTSGFTAPANNTILHAAAAGAAGSLALGAYLSGATNAALQADAAPLATAALEVVGTALSGDVLLYGPGSIYSGGPVIQPFLESAATINFTTLGLMPGEWVYLGDADDMLVDVSASEHNFVGAGNVRNRGYCRIGSISATQLVFDLSIGSESWALGTGAGGSTPVGVSGFVSMYFGTVIRNEPIPANIVRTTYTLQRYLGQGVNNEDNLEYVSGAVPNEFTLTIPSNSKLACDFTFVGMNTEQAYLASLPGTYVPLTPEDAYNTSQDMYAMLLYIIDTTKTTQAPLFGYATNEKLVINNNTKTNKAIGVVGGFEANTGNFDVSGSLTCYFDDIAALQAVRQNANVGLTNIFAKENAGFILDLPLLTLGTKGLKVEQNKPIMADVTHTASPGVENYTTLYNNFTYLPASAMAEYVG